MTTTEPTTGPMFSKMLTLRLTPAEWARLEALCSDSRSRSKFVRDRIFSAPQASPDTIAQSGKVAAHA